jgi:hypothetical protein
VLFVHDTVGPHNICSGILRYLICAGYHRSMALAFVEAAVLTSTDGVSYAKEVKIEPKQGGTFDVCSLF